MSAFYWACEAFGIRIFSERPMNPGKTMETRLLWLLRFGTAACFLGWAWQHLYWSGPYNTLLWNPAIFDFLGKIGMDWDAIVGRGDGSGFILVVGRTVGWLLLACGIVSFTVRRASFAQMAVLGLGTVVLCVVAYANFIRSKYQHPMLVEHGGQVLMPVVLMLSLQYGCFSRPVRWTAVLALVTTFAGHGAFAIGWAPTPGHFLGMIRVALSVPEEWALVILRTAGWLDLAVCMAVFIPVLRPPALLYAAAWGAATALARPLTGMDSSLIYWGADQFLHEAVVRLPHVVIPLFLFWSFRKGSTTEAISLDALDFQVSKTNLRTTGEDPLVLDHKTT